MLPEQQGAGESFSSPTAQDWELFRQWASQAGWRVPERELGIYRNELADSAFVLRDVNADPLGFVTACRQQRSAWIGNLIVDPARRGSGFGGQLFRHAVGTLAERGVATLWLTASAEGRHLYQTCGFREVERVERWAWSGVGPPREGVDKKGNGELYALVRADTAVWGQSRAGLLSLLAPGGQIATSGRTAALLQPGEQMRVLGPWLSADLCPRANRNVLSMLMETCSGAGEIVADVIGGSPVRLLLHAAGFRQVGETMLMLRGEPGGVRLAEVVTLASLGSMG